MAFTSVVVTGNRQTIDNNINTALSTASIKPGSRPIVVTHAISPDVLVATITTEDDDGSVSPVGIGDGTNIAKVPTDASESTNVDGNNALQVIASLYARIDDDTVKPAKLDGSSHDLVGITQEHHEVHEGDHYHFAAIDEDLDTAATMEFLITTPNTTKWGHFVWSIIGALTTKIELFEDPTHTTNVLQSTFNSNRNSLNTAALTIHTSNDDNADGTRIDAASFGIDTGIGASIRSGGGAGRGGQEWILKQNAKYLVRVTSGADNNNVTLRFTWYEHTAKD